MHRSDQQQRHPRFSSDLDVYAVAEVHTQEWEVLTQTHSWLRERACAGSVKGESLWGQFPSLGRKDGERLKANDDVRDKCQC